METPSLSILLLSGYLPAIDTTACARKSYDSIRILNKKGYHVFLVSFCSQEDKRRISAISPYCTQIDLEYLKDYFRFPYKCPGISKSIEALAKNRIVHILQCENSFLSRYISVETNIPSLLVEHEVLSKTFYERLKFQGDPINKVILFCRSIKKLFEEKRWYHRFNKIIVFSKEDKDAINNLYSIKDIEVVPLGVNLEEFSSPTAQEKTYDIIFAGNFSHAPNVDAVLYFYKNILPLVRKSIPNASVIIVGANPTADIFRLTRFDKNIIVTGYVPDIKEFYDKSKVFVAPIRCGTGMRLKIIDALASGIPVVATSIAARGMISKDAIAIADTKNNFACTVIDLLNNTDKYINLARRGSLAAEKYYSNELIFDRYEKIYQELLN
jgi:glycosyltransferase involved in cell wall biosynthesis